MKKKYALVGASTRAFYMYAKPLTTWLSEYAEVVGVYDVNTIRAGILSRENANIPVFESFESMISEGKPDAVIITVVDAYHHEYIIKSLEAGCDAITEKPMTIDAEKCRAILEVEKRTGKKVVVTFNYRFAPYVTRIKELIKEGTVGEILNIDFEWMLDRDHGASYFRRWNRYMQKSGGLLVHKSTHHFDLVNWWLEEDPEEVHALGTRRVYGPTGKEKGYRCLTCTYKETCEFYWDIKNDEHSKRYYLEAENNDGYIRDKCVFDDDIDIYDTMALTVKYSKGALLTYSLTAHSPFEGWRIAINGSKGRIEAEEFHSGQRSKEQVQEIRLYNLKGEVITYHIPKSQGGHGGGDERLLRMIIAGDIPDPLGHQAGSRAGAMSVIIGAAANISIADKRPVNIKELL